MGGGASKRRKEEAAAAEKAAKKAEKKNKRRTSIEEQYLQYQAYHDSLINNKKENNEGIKSKDEDQPKSRDDHDVTLEEVRQDVVPDCDSQTDNIDNDGQHENVEEDENSESVPEDGPLPPVQILNPQVFEEFSADFKARFIEDHQVGRQVDIPRYDKARYKKVNKVKIFDKKSDIDRDRDKHARIDKDKNALSCTFEVASYPWLRDLNAAFAPPPTLSLVAAGAGGTDISQSQNHNNITHSDSNNSTSKNSTGKKSSSIINSIINSNSNSSSINNSSIINSNSGAYLVDAKNRSIASIQEINQTHVDASCLALDLSSNRFSEVHFRDTLSNLLYLNVAGNLLVSLEGIHCCKHLIVSEVCC